MTIQWPDERNSAQPQIADHFKIDIEDELRRMHEECPAEFPSAFDETIAWIAGTGDDTSELENRMRDVSKQLDLDDFPDSVNLLMAWVCALSLAQHPTLNTWKNVRALKRNSWKLEHWLFKAMIFCLKTTPDIKDSYIKLAKDTIDALEKSELTSQSERHNQERTQYHAAWLEASEKLEEIWWGLRGWNSMSYEEEFPLFQVLHNLDTKELLAMVSRSKYPCLADSALTAVGAFSKFKLWQTLARTAPVAFDTIGTWNTSVTTPLLLVIARDRLLQASRSLPHFEDTKASMDSLKQDIDVLIETIVSTLADRQDALPLFARWSTWLMRQVLLQGDADTTHVRSLSYIDGALIEAIGRKLKDCIVPLESPQDASAWEAWCYRVVLASHSHSGFMSPPESDSFLKEWKLTLDEWTDDRGKQLRDRASLFTSMTKVIPDNAAHLLAYPVVRSEFPENAWIGLWSDTQTLREIVEFGETEVEESTGYQSRTDAGRLLFLVFCIGLAIFDQRVSLFLTNNTPGARELLVQLHRELVFAVQEMRHIDDTLNRAQWLQASLHLSVRRLKYEECASDAEKSLQTPVFLATDTPTFSDYLSMAKNDPFELTGILEMALLNEVDYKMLQEKLSDASIDLTAVIASVKRLNSISPAKYPLDVDRLRTITEQLGKTI